MIRLISRLARKSFINVIFVLLCFGAPGLRAADESLTAEVTSFEICSDCPAPQARVMVKPGSDFKSPSNPLVVQLLNAGRPVSEIQSAFSAGWVRTGDIVRAIDINFDATKSALPAGTYELLLDVKSTQPPTRLKITLTQPPPKLSTPSKLMMKRTLGNPFGDESKQKLVAFIDEISKKSAATQIKIRATTQPPAGLADASGSFEFTVPNRIGHGERQNFFFKPTGEFPVGTTVGSFKISADEATDTLATIDFEIRTAVWRGYLVLTLVIGLCVSWLLKVRIQDNIRRDGAVLQAASLLERVAGEESRHLDKAFRGAYRQKVQALEKAIEGGKAEEVDNAVKLLADSWTAALKDLDTRRAGALPEFVKLEGVVGWFEQARLPKNGAEFISQARNELASGRSDLEADDLATAKTKQEQASGAIRSGLDTIPPWIEALKDSAGILAISKEGCSPTLRGTAETETPQLKAELDAVKQLRLLKELLLPEPGDCRQPAELIRLARFKADDFFAKIASVYHREFQQAEQLFSKRQSPNWSADGLNKVRDRTEELKVFLRETPDSPDPDTLRDKLGKLHKEWLNALDLPLGTASSDVQSSVKTMLSTGDYIGALTKTSAPAAAPSAGQQDQASQAGEWFKTPNPTLREVVLTSMEPARHLDPVLVQAKARKNLGKTLGRQTVLLGGMAALVGAGLYWPTWVGTFNDFSAVFFWAFGLDLTLDAIMKGTKKER